MNKDARSRRAETLALLFSTMGPTPLFTQIPTRTAGNKTNKKGRGGVGKNRRTAHTSQGRDVVAKEPITIRAVYLGYRDSSIPKWNSLSYFSDGGLVPPVNAVETIDSLERCTSTYGVGVAVRKSIVLPKSSTSEKYKRATEMTRSVLLSEISPILRVKFRSNGSSGGDEFAVKDHFREHNYTLKPFYGQDHIVAAWSQSTASIHIHIYSIVHIAVPQPGSFYNFAHYRLVRSSQPPIKDIAEKRDWQRWLESTLGV